VSTGFIGLGMMGDPMARTLLKAGHRLSVFDIRPDAVEKCRALGATGVGSAAELAGCNLVFIIVNTADQLEDVLFGSDGLISAIEKGHERTIVVMSTVSPNEIRSIERRIESSDITLVDAPVSGGPLIAELGQLSFMVGGADDATRGTLAPYLDAMGKDQFYVGELGSGLAFKLINNVVALNNAYVFTEALGIGLEAGLDIDHIAEVMSASSGSNWCTDNWEMYKQFLSLILTEPGFQRTAEKDIETAIEWTRDMQLDIPALQHVHAIVNSSLGVSDKLKARLNAGPGSSDATP
jgi:3-hydroxyisobutyrate dehydrogenase-like beta-hydroxyacid dehydrogenase